MIYSNYTKSARPTTGDIVTFIKGENRGKTGFIQYWNGGGYCHVRFYDIVTCVDPDWLYNITLY